MSVLARYGGLVAILAGCFQVQMNTTVSLTLVMALWTLSGGYYTLYLIYHTLPRDLIIAKRFIHLLYSNFSAKWKNQTVGDLFLRTASRVPDKTMMVLCQEKGDVSMTYKECRQLSSQIARYFLEQGYKKGDVVGLVMENRLEYSCYWLGLSYIGVIPALVNSNLRQQSLLHTLNVAKCKSVIFSAELAPAVLELRDKISVPLLCADTELPGVKEEMKTKEITFLPPILATMSSEQLTEKYAGYNDPIFYIYTSGTTGLPKAAIIKHSRYLFASYCLFCMGLTYEDDIMYSVLPMYHSAAHVCLGVTITEGNTAVTRKKFSATKFWEDCVKNNVTCAQYIGEIARYLYATPVSSFEKKHCIRMMFGNGLRPQIWQQFVTRFNIGQINEFYGSTEGNCSCGNFSNKVGAVGFVSVLFPFLLPLSIIKINKDTGEPMRNSSGLALVCDTGEPGELMGRIDRGHPVRDYHGYADNNSSDKKIMKNVWRMGDMFFRSGDVFVMDEFGWLYFKDRAGDTFRWKGENVSTMEVEAMISQVIGLRDCVVYGVEIPGTEGRAGMAAIPDPEKRVDLASLYAGMVDKLPSYARPIFLRFVQEIDVTGTFKMKKRDLQEDGFNPDMMGQEVYIVDNTMKTYVLVTQETYNNIVNGNMRF